jgi:arginyl-tRNA synthetase
VSAFTVAGAGFINATFTPETVHGASELVLQEGDTWGEGSAYANQSIMVEYTQPNPFKPFHIGHLMSNTIGESLVRLFESQGARVIRANYQGDVGPHVAKAIWGIRALSSDPTDVHALGKAYAHGAKAYEGDERAKQEIDAINIAIYEKSDAALNDLYAIGRETSLKHFNELYNVLGSSFDRFYFESETAPLGKHLVEEHPELFPESDGAKIFKGEEYGLHTRVFITARGVPTYEAKELGLEHLKEKEYPECDELVVTTAVEQKGYFEVVKQAITLLNPALGKKLTHIAHGMLRLPSGKMSSRTGDVITGEPLLEALIDEAKVRAKESRAENPNILAEQVAVAAIKFQILRQAAGKDIIFEREKALSMEGDSGPYVQYACARATSLLEKATATPHFDHVAPAHELERIALRFPSVVEEAARMRAPHVIATFLIDMASRFGSWYAREQIVGSADEAHKLAIVSVVHHTLKNGLHLLGIAAPEKM